MLGKSASQEDLVIYLIPAPVSNIVVAGRTTDHLEIAANLGPGKLANGW